MAAGNEPIGDRVIEVSENLERTELRDPTSGFIAYVPKGSLERGKLLVTTGDNGTTMACTMCHGANLKGTGNIPSIAGRSPSQMARQLIDFQNGARNGSMAPMMKGVVTKLTKIFFFLLPFKPNNEDNMMDDGVCVCDMMMITSSLLQQQCCCWCDTLSDQQNK